MPKQGDLETQALQVILDKGNEGILQSDLWKELAASSREGSRISIKLEGKNLVKRERELRNGRWTYRVFIKRQPADLESIIDVPCVSCDEITRCETDTEISPITCRQLDQWLKLSVPDTPPSVSSE
jgi:DNA-binding MarR family transcriptional regulator